MPAFRDLITPRGRKAVSMSLNDDALTTDENSNPTARPPKPKPLGSDTSDKAPKNKLKNLSLDDSKDKKEASTPKALLSSLAKKVPGTPRGQKSESSLDIGTVPASPRGLASPRAFGKRLSNPTSTPRKSSTLSIMYDYTQMIEFMWNSKAETVAIKASWSDDPTGIIPLDKVVAAFWVKQIEVPEGRHTYFFVIDGQKVLDPKCAEIDQEKYANVLLVEDPKKAWKSLNN